jgi:hypothetical protein
LTLYNVLGYTELYFAYFDQASFYDPGGSRRGQAQIAFFLSGYIKSVQKISGCAGHLGHFGTPGGGVLRVGRHPAGGPKIKKKSDFDAFYKNLEHAIKPDKKNSECRKKGEYSTLYAFFFIKMQRQRRRKNIPKK